MEQKPQSFTVQLGETEYTINPLPFRPAGEVRRKFEAIFTPIVETLKTIPTTDLTDLAALGSIVGALKGTLFGSMDIVLELLIQYAPNLAADQDKIKETAYDTQILAAFVEVAQRLFPFGQIPKQLTGLPLPQITKK
jgi:hypothetical protein